jgi:hypothetical protein
VHGFAHSVQERPAGVFHQVPPVGDLGRLRQCLGRRQRVAAASITRDDLDLLLV